MTKLSKIATTGAALLLAAGFLGGCVYQPGPGYYGYYGPPVAGTVVVGGGWGCCRGGWGGGWHGGWR